MARYRGVILLLLILALTSGLMEIAVKSHAKSVSPAGLGYRDYSQTAEQYHPLKGLALKAISVEFDGVRKSQVLGTLLEFSQYQIVAPVRVQTSCNYVSGTFDTATARYTLQVANDTTDAARRQILREIRAYWKAKDAEELRDYQYLPADKYLWMQSGRYVLYQQPADEWVGATYLFVTSGKVIQLTFNGFVSGDGWGGLSTFVRNNLLFKFPETQIRGEYTPDISPQQFFARDKGGDFNKSPYPF